MYFTYIHIIFLLLLFALFGVFFFLLFKNQNNSKKMLILGSVLLLLGLGLASTIFCVLIDDYTKIAKLSNVKHMKVLMSESMQISGTITNVGKFDITACKLNVRVSNSALSALRPELFERKGGFWENFLRRRKQFEINAVSQNFTIGQKLKASSSREFSVSIRYPTKFAEPKINYSLSCY